MRAMSASIDYSPVRDQTARRERAVCFVVPSPDVPFPLSLPLFFPLLVLPLVCVCFGLAWFEFGRKLYSSETNQTFVSLLLEMFSNIIQYQYVGNAHLIYAIVRRKEVRFSLSCCMCPCGLRLMAFMPVSGVVILPVLV